MVPIRLCFRRAVLTALFLSTSWACAQVKVSDQDAANYTQQFQQKQQQSKTFSATMVQTVTPSGGGQPVTVNAKFYFEQDDKMHIKYDGPKKELIIIHGSDIYRKSQGKNGTTTSTDAMPQGGRPEGLFGLFFGLFRDGAAAFGDDFDVTMTKYPDKDRLKVRMKADGGSGLPEGTEIITHLRLSDLELVSVTVNATTGQKIHYKFSNIKRGQDLDDQLFEIPMQ